MAININKLKASTKAFTNIQTSIGDLYLFEVRVKELVGIEKKLDSKLEELGSENFFRLYLPFFAYLKQDLLGEELTRPEEYTLKAEEVDMLSKNELEEIAKLFIEKHSFFYKDLKSSSSKNDEGEPVIFFKEEVDESLLKHDNESYIEYIYRLVLERHKKDRERVKKMFSSFSLGLSSDILKTIGMGESLKSSFDVNSLEKSISSNYGTWRKEELDRFPTFDYDIGQQIRDQEERRLAPFEDLSSKIDLMIEAEKQTVSFMSNVYKTQVKIANELKTSSDSANENSKLNIKLTKWVLWLTAFAVFISAASLIYTIWFDNSSQTLVGASENIKSSTIETNLKLEKLTEILIEQNKMQGEQIKLLREVVNSKLIIDGNASK